MWILILLLIAAAVGLSSRLSERRARLAMVPIVLAFIAFEAIASRLI